MIPQDAKTYTRTRDLAYVARCVVENDCCAIVGVSNIGKSSLLRQVRKNDLLSRFSEEINGADFGFVYIDFNLQLQMTGQGFYELVLRTVLTELRALKADSSIIERVNAAYQQIIAPTDEFQNALSFNQAIIILCEEWSRRLILLFDEFDEVYRNLDARVFLNLRALRDRYPENLMYIAVVGSPLPALRHNSEIGEFSELFTHHTYHLQSLVAEDVIRFIGMFGEENHIQFSEQDMVFVQEQSGGHPGLLETICQLMANDTVAGVARDLRATQNRLADDNNVQMECVKLWNSLTAERQKALLDFVKTGKIASSIKEFLIKRGILVVQSSGQVFIFGKLFEDFVRRQLLVNTERKEGIVIDIDSGQVYIDGKQADLLTKLEYRLLLLLYGNLEKICDKYRIVEAVWGEDYIEEVDDARIEKLISRLRQKIEPDPSEPKFLVTVRGRGYRLQSE